MRTITKTTTTTQQEQEQENNNNNKHTTRTQEQQHWFVLFQYCLIVIIGVVSRVIKIHLVQFSCVGVSFLLYNRSDIPSNIRLSVDGVTIGVYAVHSTES